MYFLNSRKSKLTFPSYVSLSLNQVLFCRRHADAEANGKEGTLMAQLREIASGITSCFAACLGFRKGRVAEDCELTPRPNRSVPPPLLVHEI